MVNVADALLATGRDDAPAVLEPDRVTTYARLRHDCALIASALRELNLPAGSRVGLLGQNSSFWVAAYLAAMKLGLVVAPLGVAITAKDLRRNTDAAGLRAFLVDRAHLSLLAATVPADAVTITDEVLERDGDTYWPTDLATDPDSDAALMFTSGTTARPRAVRITHRNILANTESIISYLGLRSDDRMLVVLAFNYCFGASLLHTHLRVGGSVALCGSSPFPEAAIQMAEASGCTGFAGVPSSLQMMLRASSLGARPIRGLRTIQQAGGKMHPVQLAHLAAAQPQARVFVMYGQTEATARLSYLPPERLAHKSASIGRGIPGVELTVVDSDGRPVAPGIVGEIVARGEGISPGYLDEPEATAAKFPAPGTLRTGDLGTVDTEGYIYVLDRKDDFIKTLGYRVSSHEIEACTLQMPELVAAGVVGVPDEGSGEAIVLFAAPRPGAIVAPGAIRAYLRQHLAKHMIPKQIHVVPTLPLNANGKVIKTQLREWATTGVPESESSVPVPAS